jgi:hypothetical protein
VDYTSCPSINSIFLFKVNLPNRKLFGIWIASFVAAFIFIYFVFYPVVAYFDPKGMSKATVSTQRPYIFAGLRKYPNMTWYAGLTNLAFMIEAHRGLSTPQNPPHNPHRPQLSLLRRGKWIH